jgi:hypothetical protein
MRPWMATARVVYQGARLRDHVTETPERRVTLGVCWRNLQLEPDGHPERKPPVTLRRYTHAESVRPDPDPRAGARGMGIPHDPDCLRSKRCDGFPLCGSYFVSRV